MSKLREKMINEMKLRRFSPKTQESYVDEVSKLARYYGLSPDRIDNEKIKEYLLYLRESRKLAFSSTVGGVSSDAKANKNNGLILRSLNV